MPVDLSPLWGPAFGAIGSLAIVGAALGLRQRKSPEWYEALISIGAFSIFLGFLFQALSYMPCLGEEKNRLIANWSIFGAGLIYVAFVISWYKCRRAKKNPPKSIKKPK